jgi:hypothetical protein
MLPQARPPSEEAYHVRPDMRRSADAVSDKSVVYNLLFSVYAFPECPVQPKESGYKNNYLASHGLHVLSEQDQERGINSPYAANRTGWKPRRVSNATCKACR